MADGDYPWIKIGELENKPVYISRDTEKELTEEEIFALTRKEQVKILKEEGIKNKEIPRYEKDRVEMIKQMKGGLT